MSKVQCPDCMTDATCYDSLGVWHYCPSCGRRDIDDPEAHQRYFDRIRKQVGLSVGPGAEKETAPPSGNSEGPDTATD